MAPPGAPTAPRTRPSPTDRDALLRLAAGAPWPFLTPAIDHLLTSPDDYEIRLLAAMHLTDLRLRTPALEQIESLPGPIRSTPEAKQIEAAARRLPGDEISAQMLVTTCRRNIDALADRAGGLRGAFDAWASSTGSGSRLFRARDGNIVRRSADGHWSLRDARGDAAAVRLPVPTDAAETPPLLIACPDTPWLLERALRAAPETPNGYSAPILLTHPDPRAILDALSLVDLAAPLASPRVRVFTGESAHDDLREHLSARLDRRLPPEPVGLSTTSLVSLLADLHAQQQHESHAVRVRVGGLYAARDRAWWAQRFAEREEHPLRVLIVTSRYSSFVRHSAQDIADAVEAAGHRATLLQEPDQHSLLTSLAYWRAVEGSTPDLVIAINFTRASLRGCFPDNLPFACWVQDALSHLFTKEIGDAQGPLDFLLGHLHPALFTKFGYDRINAVRSPVLASARKFHPAPICAERRERFACEVAYVGHQSEPPERLRERLLREAHAGPVRSAIDRVCAGVPAIIDDAFERSPQRELDALTRSALRESLGESPDDAAVALLRTRCTMPFADRVFRHQTLRWAADIATRRGWRFRLYGKGWDAHPQLRAHAHPAIEHGEDLRACYQAARVHLHVSINTLAHQRVFECALSGGLPVCRLHRDELAVTEMWCARQCLDRGASSGRSDALDADLYPVADHDFLLWLTRTRQRLGAPFYADFAINDPIRRHATEANTIPRAQQADFFLGGLDALTFASPESLEAVLARAVEREPWRADIAAGVRGRVSSHLTYEAFIPVALRRIASALAR